MPCLRGRRIPRCPWSLSGGWRGSSGLRSDSNTAEKALQPPGPLSFACLPSWQLSCLLALSAAMEKGCWLPHSITLRHRADSDSHRALLPVTRWCQSRCLVFLLRLPHVAVRCPLPGGEGLREAETSTREGLGAAAQRGVSACVCVCVCVGGAPRRHMRPRPCLWGV